MTPSEVDRRLAGLERAADRAAEDSRSLLEARTILAEVRKDVHELGLELAVIRSAQGRNFIVSLIAATASIGTIAGLASTLLGGP